MPLTYPHPPTRAAYETAVANLARLGGPTPPKTISVGPRPGDGKPQGDVEGNPEFDAYRQASTPGTPTARWWPRTRDSPTSTATGTRTAVRGSTSARARPVTPSEQPRVFRTGFLLVLCYFLAVQPSVVDFLRCAVSES
jgi:hypothetical protein